MGREHPMTANRLHNLASLLEEQGKIDEAGDLYVQVRTGLLQFASWQVFSCLVGQACLGSRAWWGSKGDACPCNPSFALPCFTRTACTILAFLA